MLEPDAADENGIVRLAITAYSSNHGTNELLLLGSDEVPFSGDCSGNLVPDECELRFFSRDCDDDGILDECQTGPEFDCDADGIPDTCEADCDDDGIPNDCDPDHGEVDENFDGIDDSHLLDRRIGDRNGSSTVFAGDAFATDSIRDSKSLGAVRAGNVDRHS